MSEATVDGTAIEWTHIPGFKGETWNPTTGCDRVSPGCANCYAVTMARRLKAMGQPGYQRDGDPRTSGPGFGLSMHEAKLTEPLRWRKPRAVFVNSMSDLFHEDVSDEFLERVFATMGLSPAHIFMVLTKRPERALEFLRDRRWRQFGHSPQMGGAPCFPIIPGEHREGDIPLPNVWLGVSSENARFTYRANVLREIPAAVRFISAEPLLGSLYPETFECPRCEGQRYDVGSCFLCANRGRLDERGSRDRMPLDLTGIDWIICGGESGPGSRPFHLEHAREILQAADRENYDRSCGDLPPLAMFVKQLGAKPSTLVADLDPLRRPLKLTDRKGGDMAEWPADLRIREFPRSAA